MKKNSDLVFIIGMPGCGKSFWARNVAKHYHIHFYDLDKQIEKRENQSIADIFKEKGESYFRKIEHETIKTLTENAKKPCIASVGGGAPCFHNNMQWMNESGTTIYLSSQIETLIQNLQKNPNKRPLFKNEPDLGAKLKSLFSERKKYYEQADHIFETEKTTLESFAKIIGIDEQNRNN